VTSQAVGEHGTTEQTPGSSGTGESVLTVLVAGAANLAIAIAKAVGAVVSGSAAMLSESAHSFADTVTEVLLYVSLRRGNKPADDRHPLGYGRESYLWALLAALATFVAGAVV
jgi:divalent metal cation (Fe/Co/Zn/Cd) transporter